MTRGAPTKNSLSNYNSQNVACRKNQELLTFELQLGAAVLRENHLVANGYVNRNANTVVVYAAWANSNDLSLLWALLCGVWDYQTRSGNGLCF